MLFQLLYTLSAIEESPAEQVEATTELTTELLRTLNIGNLLEELILTAKVREFQVCQLCTAAHLIDPVDGLLCRTVDLVFTLSSTKQYIRVAHHAEVDTAMQTRHHLVVDTSTEVGILCHRQTTVIIIGYHRCISGHIEGVALVAIFEAFPVGLIGTNGPVETGIELATGGLLSLEELIEPG